MSIVFNRNWLFILGFLGVFVGTFVATVSHYGPTWDICELYFGDKTLHFFMTLDAKHLDFSKADLDIYKRPDHPAFESAGQAMYQWVGFWPVGFVSSAAAKHLLYTKLHILDAIDAHHMVLVLWVAALYVAVYWFTLRNYGFLSAVIAVLALATHPQMVAHSHFNLKDVPVTTMFTLVLITLHRAVESQRARWMVAAAALWGIALATKANAVFLPAIVALYVLYDLVLRRRRRMAMPARGWWIALACAPILALGIMLALWPSLLVDFPVNLRAHLQFITGRGLEGSPNWSIRPLVLAFTTTPLPFLALILAGLTCLGIRAARQALTSRDFLIAIWLAFPILRVSLPHAKDFDGIRHWMEFLPAAAIIAGIGGAAVITAAARRFAPTALGQGPAGGAESDHKMSPSTAIILVLMVVAWFSPTIRWNIHAHPNQIIFFNALVGGPAGAQRRGWADATDYWGSSYRSGIALLNAHADPGSMVVTGAGQALVVVTAKNWLRPDLTPILNGRAPLAFGYNRVPMYFMSVTRQEFYPSYWPEIERTCPLWRQIEVDGAVILKIFRMPPSPPPGGSRVQTLPALRTPATQAGSPVAAP